MTPLVGGKTEATMTGQRWCVRIVSLAYYFVIAPFLYDLFANGTRWRSAYLFPYILLSVSGLQIGFKESDTWVRVWYWTNLLFAAVVAIFSFFYAPFSVIASLYSWEKWIHFAVLVICLLFFPLHFFLKRRAMRSMEEDWEAEVEDAPLPQSAPKTAPPAPVPSTPAPIPTAAPVPRAPTQTVEPIPVPEPPQDDGGFLGK